jgi:hypothetical protein
VFPGNVLEFFELSSSRSGGLLKERAAFSTGFESRKFPGKTLVVLFKALFNFFSAVRVYLFGISDYPAINAGMTRRH